MARARFQDARPTLVTDQHSLEHLAHCGGVLSCALAEARDASLPGVTPIDLSQIVEDSLVHAGGVALLKGLKLPGTIPFPAGASVCVNDIAVNGVPGSVPLQINDVITIDSACEYNGWVCDAAVTVVVGGIESPLALAARRVLDAALGAVVPGGQLSAISAAARDCAFGLGFDLADEAVVHGVGASLHQPPAVFWDCIEPAGVLNELIPGMVLAIEPVVVEAAGGGGEIIRCRTMADGWSRRAPERALYEERTVVVTQKGCRVLADIPSRGEHRA